MPRLPLFPQEIPIDMPSQTVRLSTGLTLVRFAPRHLLAMTIRPEAAGLLNWCGGVLAAAPALAARGPGVTLLARGHVAACAGVSLFWPGVGEAWCVPSPWVDDHPLSFGRAARIALEILANAASVHRMQAHVLARHARGVRWIKWLGFEAEGYCPGYGPNEENTILYRRLFTCKQ